MARTTFEVRVVKKMIETFLSVLKFRGNLEIHGSQVHPLKRSYLCPRVPLVFTHSPELGIGDMLALFIQHLCSHLAS